MTIYDGLKFIGGLALFLFGMKAMGDGLERRAGNQLKHFFEKLTDNTFKGLLLGLGVTSIIQSSSATTVMVVGFVNSGVMKLSQAIGIIFGANIGTTVTAWILSLTGIQGDSVWIQMLKPTNFTPILAAIGCVMYVFMKNKHRQDVGLIFLGFATLIFGMDTMAVAVKGLTQVPEFTRLLTTFTNPILGILAGAVFTGIIQSSSASVGILQAISLTGTITYGLAIPVIMGQNIGTCVTAMLSSIGTNKNARRAAFIHLYFNIIGTVIFVSLYYFLNMIFKFAFVTEVISPVGIAIIHSIFNILTTMILFPFTKTLEAMAYKTIPDTEEKETFALLDERFFVTPPLAVEQCTKTTIIMANATMKNINLALDNLKKFESKNFVMLSEMEEDVDMYEDHLGTYMVKLSSLALTTEDAREVSRLLHCIGDFERISDHAMNFMELAQEISDKGLVFSPEANKELQTIDSAVREVVSIAIKAFIENDLEAAIMVEPLEQVVDVLKSELKIRQIERLRKGESTTERGFIFNDLITNYERVADHCSNIAICLLQIANDQFAVHEHLNALRRSNDSRYLELYNKYIDKYSLL